MMVQVDSLMCSPSRELGSITSLLYSTLLMSCSSNYASRPARAPTIMFSALHCASSGRYMLYEGSWS